MSLKDYRKMIFTNNSAQWIGVECSDGKRVTLMISSMQGYAPWLTRDEVDAFIDALVEVKQVME